MLHALAIDAQQSMITYVSSLMRLLQIPAPMVGVLYAFAGGMFALGLTLGQVSNITLGVTTYERKHNSSAMNTQYGQSGCVANWLVWLRGSKDVLETLHAADGDVIGL